MVRPSPRPILWIASLCVSVFACTGNATNDREAPGPSPRPSDPPLSHSWTMPASASAVAQADLGTHPEALAEEMMREGTIAGVIHRVAAKCAAEGRLPRPGMVALRFALADGGSLREVEGDPPAPAGACLAENLRAEAAALKSLPAGAALVRIQLHAPPAGDPE